MDGKLLFDAYGYYGTYTDFLGRKVFVQSTTASPITLADTAAGFRYSLPVNSTDKVNAFGFGVSVDLRLKNNFTVGGNVASDRLNNVPTNFVAFFNAKMSVIVSIKYTYKKNA
jgi:hypothetical protein